MSQWSRYIKMKIYTYKTKFMNNLQYSNILNIKKTHTGSHLGQHRSKQIDLTTIYSSATKVGSLEE